MIDIHIKAVTTGLHNLILVFALENTWSSVVQWLACMSCILVSCVQSPVVLFIFLSNKYVHIIFVNNNIKVGFVMNHLMTQLHPQLEQFNH